MADKRITVREFSTPKRTFILTNADLGSEVGAVDPVDVTAYAFNLTVKRGLEDTDDEEWFDLEGVVESGPDGSFSFTLTADHTTLPLGVWPAEIRWWADGDRNKFPDGAWAVDFEVVAGVDQVP